MCLDSRILIRIVDGNRRFIHPLEEPEPYFFIDDPDSEKAEEAAALFYETLRYAVRHADALIEGAFDARFYDFYGVNQSRVHSPAQMCAGLRFDFFALDLKDHSVCAYLSNDQFLFGHFIEVQWDRDWKLVSRWIN